MQKTTTYVEKRLAAEYLKKAEAAFSARPTDMNIWKRNRKYVTGRVGEDADGAKEMQPLVRANLVHSTMHAMVPHIYAQNPRIMIRPGEQTRARRDMVMRDFARTAEILVNRALTEAGLKKAMKRMVRGALTCGYSWLKVVYQKTSKVSVPWMRSRIEDTQDDLRRVQAALLALKNPDDARDKELLAAELEMQLRALNESAQVLVAEGIVLEVLQTEDVRPDLATRFLCDYRDSPRLIQRIEHTPASLEASYPVLRSDFRRVTSEDSGKPGTPHVAPGVSSTAYATPFTNPTGQAGVGDDPECINVYEIHDRHQQTIFTVAEGYEGFVCDPIMPRRLGERWYPFFLLAYNWVDGEYRPLSDVEQWVELQDEYNTTRTNFAEHRRRAVPARIGSSNAIKPADAMKIADPAINELILIDTPLELPAQNAVGVLAIPPVDAALYDTSPIRADLDMVSGLQDAQRGSILRAKTATEAEIANAGLQSRVGERRDENEELVAEVGLYTLEVLLQEMRIEQAQQYAGPDAVWHDGDPETMRARFYDLAVEVRAGSAGRPNAKQEQEAWAAAMPVIRDAVSQIVQLQTNGAAGMAEAMKELVNEMLRRFDERISIDQFLPPEGMAPSLPSLTPPMPGATGAQSGGGMLSGPVSMTGGSAANTSDVPPKNNPTFQ